MSASSSRAREPASIATRASRTACPTCRAFQDGSKPMNIRRILMAASVLVTVLPEAFPVVSAQGQGASAPTTQMRPIEPQEFVRLAYSSASLQAQAARLAAGRDTRPEVKD